MAWVSPTSHDPYTQWGDPDKVYDENTDTYAFSGNPTFDYVWTPYLEVYRSAIQSNKVRFMTSDFLGNPILTQVEVRINGVWTVVYYGTPPAHTWQEASFAEGSVDGMRLTVYLPPFGVGWWYEADFWQLPPPAVGYSYGDGLVTITY